MPVALPRRAVSRCHARRRTIATFFAIALALPPAISLATQYRGQQPSPRVEKVDASGTLGCSASVAVRAARLVEALDDGHYAVRLAARDELRQASGDAKLAPLAMEQLKKRLALPGLSLGSRQEMHALWLRARGTWLLDERSPLEPLEPVTEAMIDRWVGDLTAAIPADSRRSTPARIKLEAAERSLEDLLACDGYVTTVKAALEKQRAASNDDSAVRRIEALLEWTRPAMVAECWQDGRNTGIQHLLIGFPNHSPGADRPSHFDRIDERQAHCVSGHSLSPGDWPVGVLFPHPRHAAAQFHLVNLPTPRRRMAYEHAVRVPDDVRFAMLTTRTLADLARQRRLLLPAELQMLEELDAEAVSRFAGEHLLSLDDRLSAAPGDEGSHHLAVCALLLERGTASAAAGLLDAIEKGRIASPPEFAQRGLPLLAALAIAQRDPWPAVEPGWLVC